MIQSDLDPMNHKKVIYCPEMIKLCCSWVKAECILTKLNPSSNQEKRPIQIKIISTQDKNYTFEYSLVGDSKNTQRGTIQKID